MHRISIIFGLSTQHGRILGITKPSTHLPIKCQYLPIKCSKKVLKRRDQKTYECDTDRVCFVHTGS